MKEKLNKKEKYKDVQKGKSKIGTIIIVASLLAMLVVANILVQEIKDHITEKVSQDTIATTIDTTKLGENIDGRDEIVKEITIEDLYKNIYLGEYYYIEECPLYSSSEDKSTNNKLPSGYYKVTMESGLNSDNRSIETKSSNEDKENIQKIRENNEDIRKVRVCVGNQELGDYIGWIDINKSNFKDLTNQLQEQEPIKYSRHY